MIFFAHSDSHGNGTSDSYQSANCAVIEGMESWSTRVRTGALPRFAVVFILIFLIHSTGTAASVCAAAPIINHCQF